MNDQIQITAKVRKVANGFVVSIPKALVDTKLISEGEVINLLLPLKGVECGLWDSAPQICA